MTSACHIMIATPCYGGVTVTGYVRGMVDATVVLAHEGITFGHFFNTSDSLITRARNILVADFLADASFTHLMWIDADIGFSGHDLLRLIQADRAIAAGVYPIKTSGWEYGLREDLRKGATFEEFRRQHARYPATATAAGWVPDEEGFVDAIDAPTGFMLIKREVLLAFVDAYPFLKCNLFDSPNAPDQKYQYDFFGTGIDPETGKYLSEDYVFCRRALKLGFKIAIDARSNLTHQGFAIYTGDLAQSLTVQGRFPGAR